MEFPQRKPNRLSHYDYSAAGAYFITICIQDRRPILGAIVGGGALDAPSIQLTRAGQIVRQYIESGNSLPNVTVDKYVVMPNHIHMILLVSKTAPVCAESDPLPANAVIPHFVSTLKRFCHRDIGEKIFQRSYHDHIIRNDRDYLKIWQYIDSNPAKWQEDCFYISQPIP